MNTEPQQLPQGQMTSTALDQRPIGSLTDTVNGLPTWGKWLLALLALAGVGAVAWAFMRHPGKHAGRHARRRTRKHRSNETKRRRRRKK